MGSDEGGLLVGGDLYFVRCMSSSVALAVGSFSLLEAWACLIGLVILGNGRAHEHGR